MPNTPGIHEKPLAALQPFLLPVCKLNTYMWELKSKGGRNEREGMDTVLISKCSYKMKQNKKTLTSYMVVGKPN